MMSRDESTELFEELGSFIAPNALPLNYGVLLQNISANAY